MSIMTVLLPSRTSNLCEPTLTVLDCTLSWPVDCVIAYDRTPETALPWPLYTSSGTIGRSPDAK